MPKKKACPVVRVPVVQNLVTHKGFSFNKILSQNGISRTLAKEAISIAQTQGRLTIFSMVDALTRIARTIVNAGDRVDVDHKAGRLLALAA